MGKGNKSGKSTSMAGVNIMGRNFEGLPSSANEVPHAQKMFAPATPAPTPVAKPKNVSGTMGDGKMKSVTGVMPTIPVPVVRRPDPRMKYVKNPI
jgi:hypothetical protein